jgi:hypothetical protein
LGDEDPELRWRAARALGAIGPDAADAVPDLTTALGDETPLVRAQAAYALGQMGEASKPSVTAPRIWMTGTRGTAGGGAEMLVPKRGKSPITTCPGGRAADTSFHTVTYGI